MFKCVNKTVFLSIRGNKRRIFTIYTIIVVLILKVYHGLVSTDKTEVHVSSKSEYDALLRSIESTTKHYPEIRQSRSHIGYIDDRTPDLLYHLRRNLLFKPWLLGNCELRPISHGILGQGKTATIEEYVAEVLNKRTVLSVAHKDFSITVPFDDGITLLTQLSANRYELLMLIASKWAGPINVAIYTPLPELSYYHQKITKWLNKIQRKNIMVHLVQRNGRLYPVNWLRNLVLENSTTEYVVTVDADFIPTSSLMSNLLTNFNSLKLKNRDQKHALIVPAFESFDPDVSTFSESKSDLLDQIEAKRADVFHHKWHPAGHRIWQFEKWQHNQHLFTLTHEKVCSEPEPYIAMKRLESPYFPETLIERGKNKVAYYFELCIKNFKFSVIPEGHLMHLPHPESAKALIAVERCMMDGWLTYRSALARVTLKSELYENHIPKAMRSLLYFLESLFFESLWFLFLQLPLILVIVTRILLAWRRTWREHKLGHHGHHHGV